VAGSLSHRPVRRLRPGRPKPPARDPGDGFFMRHLATPLVKVALREHYADLALMEDVLRDSGLDWTIVRPWARAR